MTDVNQTKIVTQAVLQAWTYENRCIYLSSLDLVCLSLTSLCVLVTDAKHRHHHDEELWNGDKYHHNNRYLRRYTLYRKPRQPSKF